MNRIMCKRTWPPYGSFLRRVTSRSNSYSPIYLVVLFTPSNRVSLKYHQVLAVLKLAANLVNYHQYSHIVIHPPYIPKCQHNRLLIHMFVHTFVHLLVHMSVTLCGNVIPIIARATYGQDMFIYFQIPGPDSQLRSRPFRGVT